MAAESRAQASLDQTVDIETPELVVLSYTIAGVGSRVSAAIIDYLICISGIIALSIGFASVGPRFPRAASRESSVAWAIAILTLAVFFVFWLYYVLFEAISDGQTPGKRVMKLRVVRDGGLSVTFGASAVRNLVRFIDMQPVLLYMIGMIGIVSNRRGKRLGDWAAGTLVVKEGRVRQPAITKSASRAAAENAKITRTAGAPLHAALNDAEYQLLDRYMDRQHDLDLQHRDALAQQLTARFATALQSVEGRTDGARLIALHDREKLSRELGVSGRSETGAARERHAIIASSSAHWAKFASRLADAQANGLKSLGEEGVRRFVQDYRDLAADLARLRTATRGQSVEEVFYLNRLVSTAHNLLYRRRSLPLRAIVHFLFTQVPREIRTSWRPIVFAALLLFAPMAIAWTSVVRHPDLASTLLPAGMLDRAEKGVIAAKTGKGYIDDPGLFRPVMATSIITNNVQVAFAAFATGITAGLLTVWVLISNGISIGSVFGLYDSKGIVELLFKFVAPHGVLELTAICIAGGAGFLLAAGMLIPGNRTRRRALVENGRRAITLVGGAALLLVVAGSIEGFVSPIETWSLAAKLSVSGASAVVLAVYLSLARQRTIVAPQNELDDIANVEDSRTPRYPTTAPLSI